MLPRTAVHDPQQTGFFVTSGKLPVSWHGYAMALAHLSHARAVKVKAPQQLTKYNVAPRPKVPGRLPVSERAYD